MFAQINHVAIVSAQWSLLGCFYEAAFGMKAASKRRPASGLTIGDGTVGININPRRDGYVAALDHFGMLVDDVDAVLERLRARYPRCEVAKRPSSRPFAAYSTHDPDGNVFDLAQKKNDARGEIYGDQAAKGWSQDRYVNKFAIRTVNADKVAEFYRDVFELEPLNRKTEAPGHHLTDGRVTLSIMPWSIGLFDGANIKRPGADHFGFKVESIAAFRRDLDDLAGYNYNLAPSPLGGSKEADARLALLKRCSLGQLQIADPDGNWLDISED